MTRRATLLDHAGSTAEFDQDRVRADRRRLVRAAHKHADTRRISSRGRWREDWPDDDLRDELEQEEPADAPAEDADPTGAGRGAAVQEGGEVADVEVVPPAPLFAAVPMTGMLDAAPYADTAAEPEVPDGQPATATASTYANLYSSYIAQAAEAARYSAEYANRADAEDAAESAAEMAYGLGRVYAEADPPLALHRHHVALGPVAGLPNTAYYLGGMEWTGAFARYIGGAVPKAVAAERRRRECWWLDPTICARVEAVLGAFALAALLAWLRDDVPYHTVIRKARKGERWLARQQSKAEHALRDWGVGRLPPPTWLRPAIEMAELYVA